MLFKAIKIVIDGGNYEYESMLSKLDLYLLGNRITESQYNELKALMDSKLPVEEPTQP